MNRSAVIARAQDAVKAVTNTLEEAMKDSASDRRREFESVLTDEAVARILDAFPPHQALTTEEFENVRIAIITELAK